MQSSFLSKLLISLCIITIAALIILLTVFRPRYESVAVAEKLRDIQRLQTYSAENIDRTLSSWSNVTRFIAGQVMEHPKEGEIVLRSMMALHPNIIQIKIHSSNSSDELVSRNTVFPSNTVQLNDNEWFYASSDSILRAAWVNDSLLNPQYFITQIKLQIEKNPFVLTVVWNAKQLSEVFSSAPICRDYYTSIQSEYAVLITNNASINTFGLFDKQDTSGTYKSLVQGKNKWRVVNKHIQSFPFTMVVAIPESAVIGPVENFVIYSASFILGLMSTVFIVCIFLIMHMKRSTRKNRPKKTDAPGH
jgi:hypothetical protein